MSTPTTPQSQVSRPLLIALAVVAVLAVGYLAYATLGPSGDVVVATDPSGSATSAPTDGDTIADSESVDDPSERPSEIAAVEPTFQVFDARDPFDQLVTVETADGGATVGTTAPAADTAPTDGTAPVDGSQPTSTPPGNAGGSPSSATVGSTTILLDDVFTSAGVKTAIVVVDNEGYEATEGQTVAGKVTVLDIAGSCATLRFKDKRFILCEGEQITK